ncbi:MFS general substrate transporter [Patellaria atrata CBS 101060]|uniref:MFS general substrate transporter n=1 Tax=Patellaria atrata CBS 101060 TaxID=1346257 RepID=A0A9P4SHF7_9PEZI|nr:MFS general substrate transporter [Patellaria atrata CBS 101060]
MLPPLSRATSSIARSAVRVSVRSRRGLFAFLSLVPEVTEPKYYARRTKWAITATVAFAAMAGPMGSVIVLPALQDISQALKSTPTITNLSVAVYMLSMSIFPLWWSSFSETFGRRSIYLVSFALFVGWNVLAAIAQNISMLIVMRVLGGGAAASVQAVGAGTIADIWEPKERGRAMSIFYLGPLCGPLFAPIIGGILTQKLGWRSTMWFLVIYGGITFAGILFLLPETLKLKRNVVEELQKEGRAHPTRKSGDRPNLSRVSTRQSVQITTKRYMRTLRRYLLDPLSSLLFLRYPAVLLTVYYASITFGSLYFLNISIQTTFSTPPYSFETLIVGLLYIPNSLGYVLASIFGGPWIDYIMAREARKAGRYDDRGKLILRPEDRMKENAWIAAVLFPLSLIWYGWAVEKGVHWIVPVIANFFFGIGSMLVFALATTMLTELLPSRSASAVAVNNFVRNIFSFLGGVLGEPLIVAIGNGWLFTLLGILSLVSGVAVIWGLGKYGDRWRVGLERRIKEGKI